MNETTGPNAEAGSYTVNGARLALDVLVDSTRHWIGAFFLAGLMLVIAGAAMVLVFAPKSHPPAPAPQPVPEPKPVTEEKEPTPGGEAGIA